jgi:hypothetical protein
VDHALGRGDDGFLEVAGLEPQQGAGLVPGDLLDVAEVGPPEPVFVVTDKLGLPGPGEPGRAGVKVRVLAVLRYLQDAGGPSNETTSETAATVWR